MIRSTFDDCSPKPPKEAVEMLEIMLKFDPEERISMKGCLCHAYLDKLHEEEDEPEGEPLDTRRFEFERRKIDETCLREELILEAFEYFPQLRESYHTSHSIEDYRLLKPNETL